MRTLNILLFGLGCAISALLIKEFVIPYVHIKITFWMLSYRIKRMANKHNGKLKEDLINLSNQLKEVAKEEKL